MIFWLVIIGISAYGVYKWHAATMLTGFVMTIFMLFGLIIFHDSAHEQMKDIKTYHSSEVRPYKAEDLNEWLKAAKNVNQGIFGIFIPDEVDTLQYLEVENDQHTSSEHPSPQPGSCS